MTIDFSLNGKKVSVDAPPEKRLIDVIREDFGLTQTKKACTSGECGSCTVLLDGQPVPSCQVPVFTIRAKRIITIEGFSQTKDYTDIIEALTAEKCIPCPYCFSGKVLAVHRLIENRREPEMNDIMLLLSDHVCNCTPVSSFLQAVKRAFRNREFRGERRR